MEIFHGLTTRQMDIIRFMKSYREVDAGQIIFNEGDPAESLFTVVSGKVAIFRMAPEGRVKIIELGTGEVFGEMGLLVRTGRTASARAEEKTLLFEIPNNAIATMKDVCGPEASIRLLQNLVVILSERLARQNMKASPNPESWLASSVELETGDALDTVARALPKRFLTKNTVKKQLKPGEYLCREGDEPDGFYFIHEGTLQVSRKAEKGKEPVTLDVIEGPTITGQAAFYSGRTRNANLMAVHEVSYTHFTAAEFEKMKKKDPGQALDVLFATAQYLVYWLARG